MDASQKPCSSSVSTKCRDCALKRICLPATLQDAELEGLEGIIKHNRRLSKQQHLYRANEPAQQLYALRSGSLKTYLTSHDGSELVTGFVFPGELIGLDAFGGERSHSHAMALEPSLVCVIPVSQLEELVGSSALLRRTLLRSMSRELQIEQAHLRQNRENAGQRFVAFLLDLSARNRRRGLSASEFTLPMTRSEIGSYLGLTTETVSRLFTRYRQLGLIQSNGRDIRLIDMNALHLAHEGLPQPAGHWAAGQPSRMVG